MRKIKLLTIVILTLILSANKCSDKKNIKSLFDDQCPLSYKIEWTVVEDGVSVDKQIELLSTLALAAEADANKVSDIIGKANASVKSETKFELSKAIQTETIRKAVVSQDVFDEYIRIRTASCNIWDGIKNDIYGTDEEALKIARELFTDIQKKFAQLEEKKEPKLIIDKIDNKAIYFSIANYLDDNYKLTITEIEVIETYKIGGPSMHGFGHERHKLPSINLVSDNSKFDLLDDRFVLKLPANDASSFYFGLNNFEKHKRHIGLELVITYISPESGEQAQLNAVVYRNNTNVNKEIQKIFK